MRHIQTWLPLRGRWLAYALWCLAGFTAMSITGHYVIIGFVLLATVGLMFYWAARKKGDWCMLWAFALGFFARTAVAWLQLNAVLRRID